MAETEPGIEWYAVMTVPRCESFVDQTLRRLGYMTFYPFERVRRKRAMPHKGYKLEWVEQAYFPRYLFVAMRGRPHESFAQVNDTPLVSTVVYHGEEPLQIPHRVMDELMARAGAKGLMVQVDRTIRKRFSPGDKVRFIDDSAFRDFIATVEVDCGDEIKLWIDGLGGKHPIYAPPDAVAAAE